MSDNPFAAPDKQVGAWAWSVNNCAVSIVASLFFIAPLLACTVTCWPAAWNIVCVAAGAGLCLGYANRHDRDGGANGKAAKVDIQAKLDTQAVPEQPLHNPGAELEALRNFKALKNFEDFHRWPRGTATLDQVVESSAGVAGWAAHADADKGGSYMMLDPRFEGHAVANTNGS